MWKDGNPKIEQVTLCKDYKNGGLKNIGISFKIIGLQSSWLKQLYDSSTHSWELIPLHIITQKLGTFSISFQPIHSSKENHAIFYIMSRNIFKMEW